MNHTRKALPPSRREFLGMLAAGSVTALVGCGSGGGSTSPMLGGGVARLTATPKSPTVPASLGTLQITATNTNDGYLLIPASYTPSTPMPLVVSLAGAGQAPEFSLNLLGSLAASRGFLQLAVGKRGITWDALTYKFSYDVTFIDNAIKWAFDRVAVDSNRIILQGFSDGSTYGLGLALANGDLFKKVVAFSPGFVVSSDSPDVGKPKFFISHGTKDPVLGIDNASRKIVPGLKSAGYDVTYVEFDGGHTVPADIAVQAVDWFMA